MAMPAIDGKELYVKLPQATVQKLEALQAAGRLGTKTSEQIRNCVVDRVDREYRQLLKDQQEGSVDP